MAATFKYTGVRSVVAFKVNALDIMIKNAVNMINSLTAFIFYVRISLLIGCFCFLRLYFITFYKFRLFFTGLAYISR